MGLTNVVPASLALDYDAKKKLRDVLTAEVTPTGLASPATDEACYYVEMNSETLQWYEAAVSLSDGRALGLVGEAARWMMVLSRMAHEGRFSLENRDTMAFLAYMDKGTAFVRCPHLQELILLAYEAIEPICADLFSLQRMSSIPISDALSKLFENVVAISIICDDVEVFRGVHQGVWLSKGFKADKTAPFKECSECSKAKWPVC